MPRNTTLGKIEKDLERLTTQGQSKLLERLAHQLRTKRIELEQALRPRQGIVERTRCTGICKPGERG